MPIRLLVVSMFVEVLFMDEEYHSLLANYRTAGEFSETTYVSGVVAL